MDPRSLARSRGERRSGRQLFSLLPLLPRFTYNGFFFSEIQSKSKLKPLRCDNVITLSLGVSIVYDIGQRITKEISQKMRKI